MQLLVHAHATALLRDCPVSGVYLLFSYLQLHRGRVASTIEHRHRGHSLTTSLVLPLPSCRCEQYLLQCCLALLEAFGALRAHHGKLL